MKVVFLDRDGVINEFPGNGNYVTRLKDFHFIPGSLKALKILKDNDITAFVISNQAGVGKGVYTQEKLDHITRKMMNAVHRAGGDIRRVYYCTHRSDHGCNCRKPGIGSIEKAMKVLKKPLHNAKDFFFVGDTEVDILAGHNAGCQTIFVLSGHQDYRNMRAWTVKPDFIAKNLLEATKIITRIFNGRKPKRK